MSRQTDKHCDIESNLIGLLTVGEAFLCNSNPMLQGGQKWNMQRGVAGLWFAQTSAAKRS